VRIRERVEPDGNRSYAVVEGPAPEVLHVRALRWLLDEYPKAPPRDGGEQEIVLEIATTRLPGGRVGHAYALDGGPLGAPAADGRRGILWRFIEAFQE
jgi:hypothetical protein